MSKTSLMWVISVLLFIIIALIMHVIEVEKENKVLKTQINVNKALMEWADSP